MSSGSIYKTIFRLIKSNKLQAAMLVWIIFLTGAILQQRYGIQTEYEQIVQAAIEDYLEVTLNSSVNLMEKPLSYLVGKVGSYYYMLNGTHPKLEWYSSNATAVFQNAMGNLTSGGKILFKQGNFTDFKADVTQDDLIIEGEGTSTILSSSLADDIFYINANNVTIRNFKINSAGTKTYGANIFQTSPTSSGVLVENIVILDSPCFAVEAWGANHTFRNIRALHTDNHGFITYDAEFVKFIDCYSYGADDTGFEAWCDVTGSRHISFIRCISEKPVNDGFAVQSSVNIELRDCKVFFPPRFGLVIGDEADTTPHDVKHVTIDNFFVNGTGTTISRGIVAEQTNGKNIDYVEVLNSKFINCGDASGDYPVEFGSGTRYFKMIGCTDINSACDADVLVFGSYGIIAYNHFSDPVGGGTIEDYGSNNIKYPNYKRNYLSRTQVIGNTDISNSVADAWTDMTNMSITVNVGPGDKVRIFFSASWHADDDSQGVRFRLLRDSTPLLIVQSYAEWGWTYTGRSLSYIDSPSAGSHTYKIQWRVTDSSKTAYNYPLNSDPGTEERILIVEVIPES